MRRRASPRGASRGAASADSRAPRSGRRAARARARHRGTVRSLCDNPPSAPGRRGRASGTSGTAARAFRLRSLRKTRGRAARTARRRGNPASPVRPARLRSGSFGSDESPGQPTHIPPVLLEQRVHRRREPAGGAGRGPRAVVAALQGKRKAVGNDDEPAGRGGFLHYQAIPVPAGLWQPLFLPMTPFAPGVDDASSKETADDSTRFPRLFRDPGAAHRVRLHDDAQGQPRARQITRRGRHARPHERRGHADRQA